MGEESEAPVVTSRGCIDADWLELDQSDIKGYNIIEFLLHHSIGQKNAIMNSICQKG